MSQENVEIANRGLDASNRRDVEPACEASCAKRSMKFAVLRNAVHLVETAVRDLLAKGPDKPRGIVEQIWRDTLVALLQLVAYFSSGGVCCWRGADTLAVPAAPVARTSTLAGHNARPLSTRVRTSRPRSSSPATTAA
jgi:hypothetical protein